MKKKLWFCTFLAAAFLLIGTVAFAENDTISVLVDNEKVNFGEQEPVIFGDTTLVPIRAVFEQAGAKVSWDQPSSTATIAKGTYTVTVKLGAQEIIKNGTSVPISVTALEYNDRILIPVRAIGEALDFDIKWDGFHSTIDIATDGKPYRPYAARSSAAFKTFADAATFYKNTSFAWEETDLNGDGKSDNVTFVKSIDTNSETSPLLMINGTDFTSQIKFMRSTYAIGVVDINKQDNTREVILVAGTTSLTAYFFRYDGTNLIPILKDGENRASIVFAENLFFDGKSYILSDAEGICFTDIMLTGSAYQLEKNDSTGTDMITQYRVSNASNIIPRKLVHTYNDNAVFYCTPATEFVKGGYRTPTETTKTFYASDLPEFTVLDMYTDIQNPSYIEVFVQMPDGSTGVLVPYSGE